MNQINKSIVSLIDPKCSVYVETGTFCGESLDAALRLPQFKSLYSIELSNEWFDFSSRKYSGNRRVKLIKGDSGVKLAEVLLEIETCFIDTKCCVFLDSHYSGPGTAKGTLSSPIAAELCALVKYRRLIHQVFIDDIQAAIDLSTGSHNFENDVNYYNGWVEFGKIKETLLEINPNFILTTDFNIRVWGLLFTSNY